MSNITNKYLFGITAFIAALLLFLVQPMIAKYFLPVFGSSSSVWIVAVLFFQTALFMGYLYSHKISRLAFKMQKYLHASLVLSLLSLQLYLSRSWSSPIMPPPELINTYNSSPEFKLLVSLGVGVGGLYFILATTSTILQSWLAKKSHPYWLYRISNLGSFAAILGYPFFIEPILTLNKQADIWFLGFAFFALLVLAIIFSFQVKDKKLKKEEQLPEKYKPTLPKTYYLIWILLSSIPSIQMLSFTNHITQGISPIPLLWLLPLGLYLLSFVIGFKKKFAKFNLLLLTTLSFISLAVIFRALELLSFVSLTFQIVLYSVTLFLVSILCHHLLYKQRPNNIYLTHFYLGLAFGGMLGGLFVALLAPIFFKGLWEVDISLILGLVAVYFSLVKYPNITPEILKKLKDKQILIPFMLSLTTILIWLLAKNHLDSIYINRNFYGIVRIKEDKLTRSLINGRILHGSQLLNPKEKHIPTTYFGENSGVDIAFNIYRKLHPKKSLRVGVVGLGVGTISTYCKPEDFFIFYEINPEVISAAQKYFSFLSYCPNVKIVLGDARISLAKEAQMETFDILILDAFSDDAIPLHLLTQEAFAKYLERLEKDGILAVHISNKNLDLRPLMLGVGDKYNINLVVVDNLPKEENKDLKEYILPNIWVLLSKNPKFIEQIKLDGNKFYGKDRIKKKVVWTDNYSNILQVLK